MHPLLTKLVEISSTLRPAQLILVLLIFMLLFKAEKVLKMPAMNWLGAAFVFNFIQILLGISFPGMKGSISGVMVYATLGLFNSYLIFHGTIHWYSVNKLGLPKSKLIWRISNFIIFSIVAITLYILLLVGFVKNSWIVGLIQAVYGLASNILVVTFFLFPAAKGYRMPRFLLAAGFFVWGLVQFMLLIPEQYQNLGYTFSLLAKMSILFGLFEWYLSYAKQTESKIIAEIQAKEFERKDKERFIASSNFFKDILASIFHEVILPLKRLNSSIDELSKVLPRDVQRSQFEDVERSYELVKTIILVSRQTYKHNDSGKSIEDDDDETEILDGGKVITSVNHLIEYSRKTFKKTYKPLNASFTKDKDKPRSIINIEFDFARKCYIECNPSEINQVFINLFKNAVEAYGTRNEERKIIVRTRINKDSPENKKVIVEFEDFGPGIKPEHIDKIWNNNFSTKDPDINNPDRGKGLFLSKKIIDSLPMGKISAKSPTKKKEDVEFGTTFTIEFSLKQLEKKLA